MWLKCMEELHGEAKLCKKHMMVFASSNVTNDGSLPYLHNVISSILLHQGDEQRQAAQRGGGATRLQDESSS